MAGSPGTATAQLDAEAGELVREVEDVDRAVAREVVVVDEDDVHAAARGSVVGPESESSGL